MLRSLSRLLGYAAENDRLEFLIDVSTHRTRRLWDFMYDAIENRLKLTRERRFSGEALIQHRAQRGDIRTMGHNPGCYLPRGPFGKWSSKWSRLWCTDFRGHPGEDKSHY